MQVNSNNLVFVSMSDIANGAENVLLMASRVHNAPFIVLKRSAANRLKIPAEQDFRSVTEGHMLAGFFGLLGVLKQYRAGYTILSTHPYLNAYLGILKRIGLLKSGLIVRECTSIFSRYRGLKKWSYLLAYRLGYPAADLVICQTDLMRSEFRKNLPFVPENKIIVQKNPVDVAQNLLRAEAKVVDADLDEMFICAAGRLIPEKGFDLLIAAFSKLYGRYPGLKLLIFGDGPDKAKLAALIKVNHLQHKVILNGWIENPMPYFKHAKLCVVSSRKEGFPNVLLQMMSVNPGVVCTNCAGGISEIPGIFKADADDINSLCDAIEQGLNIPNANPRIVEEYVKNRTPEIYLNAILTCLRA